MPDPASSPPSGIGLSLSAGVAGSLVQWLGFPPALLALALAAGDCTAPGVPCASSSPRPPPLQTSRP